MKDWVKSKEAKDLNKRLAKEKHIKHHISESLFIFSILFMVLLIGFVLIKVVNNVPPEFRITENGCKEDIQIIKYYSENITFLRDLGHLISQESKNLGTNFKWKRYELL